MKLTRRALLTAAGATLALPWLPSLAPSRADDAPPKRLAVVFSPNGFRMDLWRPTAGEGPLALGPTMASLEDLRERLLVVSGVANASAEPTGPGAHARGSGTFLTCTPIAADRVVAGPSMDQVAARAIGAGTPLRSLELGATTLASRSQCEPTYPCAYTAHVAWADATTPLPPISSPRLAFRHLFAGSSPGATAALHARAGVSVLDVVQDQTQAVSRRLSGDDRLRLDAWLTGLRSLEERLQHVDTGAACSPGVVPTIDTPPLREHADLLLDLAVLAFSCDLTRVATCMLGVGASNPVHDFLPGVDTGHHDLSHHADDATKLAKLALIDAWHVERIGRFLRKLAATPEGDGSLLDSTLVLVGSEIADGDLHGHRDLPFLVASGARIPVAKGRHLVRTDAPAADLHLAVLRALGVSASTFGADGTGPLDGVVTEGEG